jgi:hypothetical protein
MKTSKTPTKSKKVTGKTKSVQRSEFNSTNNIPDEHEIRERAMEIYHQRIERGEHGTAESDWLEAEATLSVSE